MKTLTDDELLAVVQAVEEYPTKQAAADALGLPRKTLTDRLEVATRRNLTGAFLGGALPPGYTMGRVTSLVAPDGTKMEWQHKMPDAEKMEALFDHLMEAFNKERTPIDLVPDPAIEVWENYLTTYPIVDVHLGLYAWSKETGENYDVTIARDQFLKTTTSLMRLTPPSETALIVVLGDYYHADNNNAVTERSGNHLDVDGRHDKVLFVGAELAIWTIDMALAKHHNVVVKVMRGNHDPYASKALTMTLWFRYQNNPRVTIDRSPVDLWSYEYGKNMLSYTHGDNVRAEDMPGVMAAYEPEMWGRTAFRYGFSGHYHKVKKGPLSDEKHGAIWEILPAFTAKDAWNKSMGHSSHRGLQAITFHKDEGRKFTNYVTI